MTIEISRPLGYADRHAVQQADQAIRKDVVRGLVELITNANDSYHRMEDADLSTNGKIIIEVERKHSNSVIRVYDNAEGMAPDDLDLKVGMYGEDTSGFREGRSVRGLWGRGLKDSFLGLGQGSVSSIRDGKFCRCTLSVVEKKATYQREKSLRVARPIRNQYKIPVGNGSVMEIVVSREDVRVPQFDNLRRSLERHFELRAILSDPKRMILLRDVSGRGNIKSEIQLKHKAPIGTQILNETVAIEGYAVKAHLQVSRSEEPLSIPAEEGDYADGGLLVVSKGVVLALTLFKFDHNEYACRFYGILTCDYLHELLKNDDSILTATRDGINWRHSFAKSLKEVVEAKLEPLVEAERKRLQKEQSSKISKKLRERLKNALQELNSIAKLELGKLSGLGNELGVDGEKTPFVPPSGFGFVPEYAYIQTGKIGRLTLRASILDRVEVGSLVTIESSNSEVMVLTPQVRINAREDYISIGEAKVELEGRQVGAEAIITASIDDLKAEALVKVISKREHVDPPPPPQSRGGLFRGVEFDPTAEPRQRVRFDQATSIIFIATKAPSVAAYLDENGNGSETPQGQVLLAELVTEAVCFEIARRGVANKVFLAPVGGEADAIRRKYNNLQNKYAHQIHERLVDSAYRRSGDEQPVRKGRPSRDSMLEKAVVSG